MIEKWNSFVYDLCEARGRMLTMAELEDIVNQGEKEIAEGRCQPVAIEDLWK
jgi:hypothetical protein